MVGTGRYPTIQPERNFKRWFDKAFVTLMTGFIGLVLFVWNSLSDQVAELDKSSRSSIERITKQEVIQQNVERRLDSLDKRQERMDAKIDEVLKEVRNR